jgi:hypothetical protein
VTAGDLPVEFVKVAIYPATAAPVQDEDAYQYLGYAATTMDIGNVRMILSQIMIIADPGRGRGYFISLPGRRSTSGIRHRTLRFLDRSITDALISETSRAVSSWLERINVLNALREGSMPRLENIRDSVEFRFDTGILSMRPLREDDGTLTPTPREWDHKETHRESLGGSFVPSNRTVPPGHDPGAEDGEDHQG